MNLSIKDAEYILTIISEGNLTKAAQSLYVSQPSLSVTVQKIERHLGVKLFTRENNRLKPTYEGRRFAEACSNIVKTYRDVEAEFEDMRRSNGGKVTIGMPFTLICYVFPRIYQLCQEKYPDLQLIPVEGNTRELETFLMDGTLDMVLIPYFVKNPENFSISTVFKEPLILSVPQGNPLNAYAEVRGDAALPFLDIRLANRQPFILNAPGQHVRQATEIVFRRAHITPMTVFITKNVSTKIAMSAVGLGLAVFPEHYLTFSLPPKGANYYYIDPAFDPGWEVAVLYRKSAYFSSACQQCVDILTQLFQNSTPPAPQDGSFSQPSLRKPEVSAET